MTTSDKPAPEHPAPWTPNGGGLLIDTVVADANRGVVLKAEMSGVGLPYLRFADRGVRETVLAAPEMADVLREILPMLADGDVIGDCRGWLATAGERISALLARIDAAKAGG